jgi:hypothetical protein
MADLISTKTRIEFREYFVQKTLKHIQDEFNAAGVRYDKDYHSPEYGARRGFVEEYYHSVDFSKWSDVQKVLQVYENVLLTLEEQAEIGDTDETVKYAKRTLWTLTYLLKRDGFIYANGKIVPTTKNIVLEEFSESARTLDADALQRQIDRMKKSIEGDPALAIGTAKEVLETICRTILADAGTQVHDSWDIGELVKETRKLLRLVPEDVPEAAKGKETIQRIISSLGQITQGISELRNLYGTGHGKDGRAKGLGPRHARLIVACSAALSSFFLETYQDRHQK